MEFPCQLYLLAMIGAGLFTLVTLPLWRRWCARTGHVDDPGHRKIHQQPIPLAGGLAVMTGLILPLVAGLLVMQGRWLDSETVARLEHGLGRRGGQLGVVLAGAVGMLILGWLDDRWELKPAVKFGGQLLVAAAVAVAGVRITLFVPSLVFSYAVTVLWILTVINAFNFMDNMNGLCAGLGIIAALSCGLVAMVHGQYLVAMVAMLTLGALLGFLPFQLSASQRLPGRRRQPPGGLLAGGLGDPAALSLKPPSSSMGCVEPVADPGRAVARPGLGGGAALAHGQAILCRR